MAKLSFLKVALLEAQTNPRLERRQRAFSSPRFVFLPPRRFPQIQADACPRSTYQEPLKKNSVRIHANKILEWMRNAA